MTTPCGSAGERGYSLIEALTVMAVLGTILGAITGLFISGARAELEMNDRFQAQNNARLALDRLRRDVHCANGATGGGTAITLTYAQTTCIGASTVSWCTQSSTTGRFTLRRAAGSSCTSSSRTFAEYLDASSVFSYQAPSTSNLGKLKVSLSFQRPAMGASFILCDVLVLRNTTRTGTLGAAVSCP